MAEKSWLWTTGTTNDGASTYTQADASEVFKIAAACNLFEGVAPNYLNGLKTTGASSPVSMDTGGAMVDGKPYKNDAAATIAVPTPATLTRIDRLVLRADWANHLVRLTRIAGTEGGGAPAITQTPGTTYDIKLYQASITTGGVITLTDERVVASPLYRQGGSLTDWSVFGTTNFIVPGYLLQTGVGKAIIANGSKTPAANIVITFPRAFSQPPIVQLTYGSVPAGLGFIVTFAYTSISASAITINQVDCSVSTNGDGSLGFVFSWQAIGLP